MPRSGLWGPSADANTMSLPQVALGKTSATGRARQELPAPRDAGANPAAARGGLELVSPGVLCLCCHPACFDLGPRRRAVCLETHSRAQELGQGSVGISERWWAPELCWDCQELLLGRKDWAEVKSTLGGLTLLPPSSWRGCPGRERIPILIPGMPKGVRGPPRALFFPGQAINPTTMTLLPNLRLPSACCAAFYLYLQ